MERTIDELVALYEIARILAKPGDLKDKLTNVLGEMDERLLMRRGMISLLDREMKEAWLDVAHGVDISGLKITYRPGEGVTGQVALTGKPIAIPNIADSPLFLDRTGARSSLNRFELSFLCVPIIYEGRVVGVLSADKNADVIVDINRDLELLGDIAELVARSAHYLSIEEENRRLREIVGKSRQPSLEIIGQSKRMREVFALIAQVADSNTTVLINGETGTGKELVARSIHIGSSRSKGPLVMVNCAAIPDTLLESELFGHVKGAFTGALFSRRGRFEEAHGGTIFLDEVGELSPAAQAKLLRVLQERCFQPLGSSRVVQVNVRIIAATNRNISSDVDSGRFRADLYYRLNVFAINLPSLRDRGSDVLLLADHFLHRFAENLQKPIKQISPDVSNVFLSHEWHGNVRELENCMERAVLVCSGDAIEIEHLPPTMLAKEKVTASAREGRFNSLVETQEKNLIIEALEESEGNQSKAAARIGITKRVIQYKIKKYAIDPKRWKPVRGEKFR
ncbi:MAG: sigma 54-interacting transcriptional regulator [Deltaproteobacteria bacterium]|nr:sigma 54-interacting transcriptional regulator [Deltaproteobacteria bacterium]